MDLNLNIFEYEQLALKATPSSACENQGFEKESSLALQFFFREFLKEPYKNGPRHELQVL